MKNLFQEDRSSEIDDRANKIKSDIENCYENKKNKIPELQKKINHFYNFSKYEYVSKSAAFRNKINR